MNEAQIQKLSEINSKYQAILDILSGDTPAWEAQSWEKQETEAREYIKLKHTDPNLETLCPLLLQIAKNRELDFDLLVDKVIQKSNLYWHLYGILTGLRQNLEEKIKNSKDDLELSSISLDFDLEDEILKYQNNELKKQTFITIANKDETLNTLDFFSFNAFYKLNFEAINSGLTKNKELFYNVINKSTIDLGLILSEIISTNVYVKKMLKEIHSSNGGNEVLGTLSNFYKDFDSFKALLLDFSKENIF